MRLITPEMINTIADMAIKCNREDIESDAIIPALTADLKEINTSIKNLLKMVERGVESETLDSRLKELEKRKKDTESRLDAAKSEYLTLDKTVIVGWLSQFLSGDIEDEDFRRHLIDTLINSVTVWDEPDGGYKITTVYNLKGNTQTYRVNADGSSDMKRNSPPKKRQFS